MGQKKKHNIVELHFGSDIHQIKLGFVLVNMKIVRCPTIISCTTDLLQYDSYIP